MFRIFARPSWLICLLFISLFSVSCTTSTSVGGAAIETGYNINDNFEVVSATTTFEAGEDFYFSFSNNAPFGSDAITLQLLDGESKDVLFELDYEVEPEWNILADVIYFNTPGKYKIVFLIDGKTRATQDVIIK